MSAFKTPAAAALDTLRAALATVRAAERTFGPSPTNNIEYTEAEGAEAYALVTDIARIALGLVGDALPGDIGETLESLESFAAEQRAFADAEMSRGTGPDRYPRGGGY